MDDYQNEAMPVGAAEVAAATQTLQRYKAGKAALDRRLVDNELWFRMGHWKNYQNPMMPGKAQPSSGWLFNSIANKHADAMDNYPEPNVLPRAADDEATARALSSVLPVVLEQADYEQVYSDCWWRKLKQGTGVTGVFWDPAARGGVGDIAVRAMNLLMLYWEPGVADIQDSPDFFSLSLEDTAQLTARYPQLAGHTAGVLDVPRYIHEDGADTASRSVVVDWYYKRPDESGRMVLHYCKFCNGVVLYASQNDPALAQRGLYDHGQYPFVFDPLFMEEDSPAGFGYIDVMKDCQTAIDQMNHAMDENVLLSARQRYVLSDTAGVNEEELADLSRDIVHVVGRLNDDSFRPLQTAGLQGSSLSYRQSRIEELKEISGNRDMTQGGTTGGSDIIVKLLRIRFRYLKTGIIFAITDTIIVACSALVFKNIENGLYAGISLAVQTIVFDLVLYGPDEAKSLLIISDEAKTVARRLMDELDVGVTYLNGIGAYSNSEKLVILCAMRKQLFPKARTIVKEVDPGAFMIVSSANEIFGEGFKDHFGEEI